MEKDRAPLFRRRTLGQYPAAPCSPSPFVSVLRVDEATGWLNLVLAHSAKRVSNNTPCSPAPHGTETTASPEAPWSLEPQPLMALRGKEFAWLVRRDTLNGFAAPLSSGNEARKCPDFFTTNFGPLFARQFAAAHPKFHGIFHSRNLCPLRRV